MNTPDPLLVLVAWSFVGSMVTLIGVGYSSVLIRAAWNLHRQRMHIVRRSR